jgi:hypothetical protein
MGTALRACIACLLLAAAAPAVRSAPPPATAATFAIACSRIGEQAQRIGGKREGGATMEQQLAERATVLSPEDQAKTVRSVYARRGSVSEIRSQIEAECMADKAREAEAGRARPGSPRAGQGPG